MKAEVTTHIRIRKNKRDATTIATLRRMATYTDSSGKQIKGYEESLSYLELPRNILPESLKNTGLFEITPNNPPTWCPEALRHSITLRPDQVPAFDAIKDKGDGILSLRCGGGKTVLSLYLAAYLGVRTLVVTPTVVLEEQWGREVSSLFGIEAGSLRTGGKVGPVTVTTIHTMIRAADSRTLKFWDQFGLVVFDEAHHMGAPGFHKACGWIRGRRLGLTATPYRSDGLDALYMDHLGPILYEDLAFDLTPEVVFLKTPTSVSDLDIQGSDKSKFFSSVAALAEHVPRLRAIADLVSLCEGSGRRVLVLCDRVGEAKSLTKMIPGSKLLTGKTNKSDRVVISVEKPKVLVATSKLVQEGFDYPELDTLILTLPPSSETVSRQSVGRILRKTKEDKEPLVIVMEDAEIPFVLRRGTRFRSLLKKQETNYKPMTIEEFHDNYSL